MDYGIRGKMAIVCAASKGLGKGCAMALAREGVDLVINARGADALAATAERSAQADGVEVAAVAADITTPTDARRRSPRARSRISWSTMPAARRPATSATGTATPGSRRSTRTC